MRFAYLQSKKNLSSSKLCHIILHMVTKLHVQNQKNCWSSLARIHETCHIEHFAAIFNALRLFTVKQKILSSSRLCHIILHMVNKLHGQNQKNCWSSLARIRETCHFEHFAATFDALRLFTVKQKNLSSSRLCHIILHMVTKIYVQNQKNC